MKNTRILYLEDNGIDAELVTLSLKDQSYLSEIVVVDNKKQFCTKLDTESFDLILMDYDVPEISAAEAIKIVKEKKIELPIIVISGAIGYEAAIRLIKQGAHDYILKQNLIALPAAIARALNENQESITKQKQEHTQNEVIKVTHTGIFKMDIRGNCFFVNQPLCDMLGYTKKELSSNEGWLKYLSSQDKPAFLKMLHQNLKTLAPFEIETKLLTKESKIIWIKCNCIPEMSENNTIEFIGAIVDISELKKTEDELINLSRHDALTGLPNRRYFSEAVQSMIYECERGLLNAFAIFYMDLDHFKKINDVLGHQCGDELLKQASIRFKSIVRKYDIIARIGGDEFLLVFKHIKSVGEIAFLADSLLTQFRIPFYVQGHECLTTLSIGIAYVDNVTAGIDAEKIIQKADQALYRAKARGRNCYEIYTENISHEIQHTVFIENALRHAIEKNEFYLAFQPQVDVLKSCIFGFEVLLRWEQGVYGDISPTIFVPIAEESKQINKIGEWVINESFKAYKNINTQLSYFEKHSVSFSLNVSATQLLQDNFLQDLSEKMKSNAIDATRITFEITETSVIQNMTQLKNQFRRFPSTELCIAVDDFGAGYSSFTNLKELPIKVLKIDQSFVQEIENDANCRNIIKSIISLANSMKITLIAEGVESKKQADFLVESGCFILQGYYFSKPLLEKDIEDYVKNFSISQTLGK